MDFGTTGSTVFAPASFRGPTALRRDDFSAGDIRFRRHLRHVKAIFRNAIVLIPSGRSFITIRLARMIPRANHDILPARR